MRYGHYYDRYNDIYKDEYPFIPESEYNRNHIKPLDYVYDELHKKYGVVFRPYCKSNSRMLVKYLTGEIEAAYTSYLHPINTINKPTLKPCPICGGYPLIEQHDGYCIFCTTCGLQSAKLSDLYWTVQLWENRGDISHIHHLKEQTEYRNSLNLDPKEKRLTGGPIIVNKTDIQNMDPAQYCWVYEHSIDRKGFSGQAPTDFGEYTDLHDALNLYGYYTSKDMRNQLFAQYNIHPCNFVEDAYYYMLDPYRWCKDNPKMQDILAS